MPLPFKSQIIADVGISFGDEGKGRLIYELIDDLRAMTGRPNPVGMVIKVNGGANSGHTAGGLKLNLLPAGVISQEVDWLAIGSGVVADPRKFLWEGKPLEARDYNIFERLKIDERTQISDISHRLLDLAWEDYRQNVLAEPARGSTGRGISPAYAEEAHQFQLHYVMFQGSKDAFASKMRQRLARASRIIEHVCQVLPERWEAFFATLTQAELRANNASIESGLFDREEFDFHRFRGNSPFSFDETAIIDCYWEAGLALADRIDDVRELVHRTQHQGRYIIGEFGQAYWLDKRHGFPPNVTASHTFPAEIFQSLGVPLQPLHTVGVCKVYDTKVGTHLFLTEIPDRHPLKHKLSKLEFGTSTGRQRMVGWFDAVEKADALRYGGFDELAINKLDALTCTEAMEGTELLIAVAYRTPEGTLLHNVPRDDTLRKRLKPVYRQLPSWSVNIRDVRSFDGLPKEAQYYVSVLVASIMELAYRERTKPERLPSVRYIGVGPDPKEIIRDIPSTEQLLKLARMDN